VENVEKRNNMWAFVITGALILISLLYAQAKCSSMEDFVLPQPPETYLLPAYLEWLLES
jgi:hypothetical protein